LSRFFNTKEAGRGTGPGLAISNYIVKKHGGELLVKSTSGKGTTFTVRLPIDPECRIMHLKES
jgi:signal transduction histidine kinase